MNLRSDESSESSVTSTVIIEGQAVDDNMSDVSADPAEVIAAPAAEPAAPPAPATDITSTVVTDESPVAAAPPTTAEAPASTAAEADEILPDTPEAIADVNEVLALLTSLLVGSAIEGSNELLGRLREYEAELNAQTAGDAASAEGAAAADARQPGDPETSFDTLRYMLVGLMFDAQRSVGRGIGLAARTTDSYLTMAVKASRPLTHNALTRPFQRRIDRLAARGQTRVARWIEDGRATEPRSRALARMTYNEIVDDFINHLAENPEVQALVTKQSLGLASEVRDEVRERTVTADNVVESLVRRILRREPRTALPEPDPAVQEWATRRLRSSSDAAEEAGQ